MPRKSPASSSTISRPSRRYMSARRASPCCRTGAIWPNMTSSDPDPPSTRRRRHAGLPLRRPRTDLAARRHSQGHVLGEHLRAQGDAYLMGTSKNHGCDGDQPLRRWRRHVDGAERQARASARRRQVSLRPVPVVVHNGRIWRRWRRDGPRRLGVAFSFLHDVPRPTAICSTRATGLRAIAWARSPVAGRRVPRLAGGQRGRDARGRVVNILRVDYRPEGEKAAIVEISEDGKKGDVRSQLGFHRFPGRGQEVHDPLRSRSRRCTGRSPIPSCRGTKPRTRPGCETRWP